jgi:twitching motility protein PilT
MAMQKEDTTSAIRERYLAAVVEQKGTDLLLTEGAPPTIRVDGELTSIDEKVLSAAETKELARGFLPAEKFRTLKDVGEVDFSFDWRDVCRFRGNAFTRLGAYAVALRLIPLEAPTMEQLLLPSPAQELAHHRQGLILVTGPTGVGKSTTIASMIGWINANRACHVVTIEDPIEYVHRHGQAVVDQREVGIDTIDFASGLRSVLRQDPDVILIGEMRDLETIHTAITVAETGHLVFATLHTNDTAQALDRIIDVFPEGQQEQVRVQLANTLLGVIYQQLLPRADGPGRVAAFEVMLASTAVRNLIREGKTQQLRNAISTSATQGMRTIERSLSELVDEGLVSYDEAIIRAMFPQEVRRPSR